MLFWYLLTNNNSLWLIFFLLETTILHDDSCLSCGEKKKKKSNQHVLFFHIAWQLRFFRNNQTRPLQIRFLWDYIHLQVKHKETGFLQITGTMAPELSQPLSLLHYRNYLDGDQVYITPGTQNVSLLQPSLWILQKEPSRFSGTWRCKLFLLDLFSVSGSRALMVGALGSRIITLVIRKQITLTNINTTHALCRISVKRLLSQPRIHVAVFYTPRKSLSTLWKQIPVLWIAIK